MLLNNDDFEVKVSLPLIQSTSVVSHNTNRLGCFFLLHCAYVRLKYNHLLYSQLTVIKHLFKDKIFELIDEMTCQYTDQEMEFLWNSHV